MKFFNAVGFLVGAILLALADIGSAAPVERGWLSTVSGEQRYVPTVPFLLHAISPNLTKYPLNE